MTNWLILISYFCQITRTNKISRPCNVKDSANIQYAYKSVIESLSNYCPTCALVNPKSW